MLKGMPLSVLCLCVLSSHPINSHCHGLNGTRSVGYSKDREVGGQKV